MAPEPRVTRKQEASLGAAAPSGDRCLGHMATPPVSPPPFRSILLHLHLHVFAYRAAEAQPSQQISPSPQNRLCDLVSQEHKGGRVSVLLSRRKHTQAREEPCGGPAGPCRPSMPAPASLWGLHLGEATGDQVQALGHAAALGCALQRERGEDRPNRQQASPF